MDETARIKLAKKGDLEAFNQLVLTHQQGVYNLALRFMGDEMLAADMAQQSFVSAYQNLHSFRGGNFRAWLYRIAANNCYDELRRNKRRPTQPLTVIDNESGDEMEDPLWLADDGPGPEDLFEKKELEAAIQRCINALPENFRLTLVLVDIQEISYAEAARIAKTPVGTIRSRLARARQQIQDCLQGFSELLPAKYRLNIRSKP